MTTSSRNGRRCLAPRKQTRRPAPHSSQQALRITGGDWRSRRLSFPVIDGLRPTLSQSRERLFNWLQFDLAGRRVLDAYAGSGILGLEALSRGAAFCDFVERDAVAARVIRGHLTDLQAEARGQVHQTDVLTWLLGANPQSAGFDLVFLDPPFAEQGFQAALDTVAAAAVVKTGALVYLETPSGFEPRWPTQWHEEKCTRKGRIQQRLWRTGAAVTADKAEPPSNDHQQETGST